MTSRKQPPAPDAVGDEPVAQDSVDATVAATEKGAIPAFSFPFKPADFTPSKNPDQPWYQKSKGPQNKTPGPSPHGTRKSMGKR